ncbi:MAG: ABC transporter permease subunit [Patescibacteria group bacterium]|nr:ABC transporter permease subunit [Patescibacteria group bacterium]
MKPVLLWELRQRKSYFFWWTIVTIGLITLLLLLYPSIHSQATQLNKVLNQLPVALRDLKTGGSTVDISSPVGYLNSQLYYLTLPLVQISMAIGLGSSLLAREEQNRTLELLLARPISRGKLLFAKAGSGVLLVLGVGFISALVTVWLAKVVDMQISAGYLLLASTYSSLLALSFGAIAFTLSAASAATRRSSMAVAAAVSFGGYLLATLSGLSSAIRLPAKLLPYHYYVPTDILQGKVGLGLNLYLLGLLVVCTIVSWLGFRHRDIS